MTAERGTAPAGTRPDAWAASIAERTQGQVTPAGRGRRVLVVGGGHDGRRVAKGLAGDHAVHHLDDNRAVVAAAVTHEASHTADVAGFAALAGTGVERGDVAVVLTGRDGASLLVAQQLRVRFGLEHVVVGLAEPRNREAFDLPGVTVVPAGDAQVVVDAVRELVPEP